MNRTETETMIRQILTHLKYQEIPALIGQSLHITSAETVPEEVLEQYRDVLPTSTQFYKPALIDRERVISRYGILDLTYQINPTELESIEPGREVLAQQLGLFQDFEDMLEFDGGWEAELWEDLAQGNAYVRLFLQTWEQLTPEERKHRRQYGVPDDFFISTYRILDACLTNTQYVWMEKHFYA